MLDDLEIFSLLRGKASSSEQSAFRAECDRSPGLNQRRAELQELVDFLDETRIENKTIVEKLVNSIMAKIKSAKG